MSCAVDAGGIIERLERAAKAAGHAVEFRREEDGTLRRKSIGASQKGSEGNDEDGSESPAPVFLCPLSVFLVCGNLDHIDFFENLNIPPFVGSTFWFIVR